MHVGALWRGAWLANNKCFQSPMYPIQYDLDFAPSGLCWRSNEPQQLYWTLPDKGMSVSDVAARRKQRPAFIMYLPALSASAKMPMGTVQYNIHSNHMIL